MSDIEKALQRIANLSQARIFFKVFSRLDVQNKIINLNTIDQLFNKGEDSKGVTLESIGGEYKPFTVKIKKKKGLPTDKVTLFDTGDYYSSFVVIPVITGDVIIDSKPSKEGYSLFVRWGDDIEGIQDDNLTELNMFLVDPFIEEIERELGII